MACAGANASCSSCSGITCAYGCQGGCGGCTNTCHQQCNSDCSSTCYGTCSNCSGQGNCVGGCGSGCSNGCSGNCEGGCQNGCTGSNVTTIYNNISRDEYIRASQINDLRTFISNEMSRRSKSGLVGAVTGDDVIPIGTGSTIVSNLAAMSKTVTAQTQNNIIYGSWFDNCVTALKQLYAAVV